MKIKGIKELENGDYEVQTKDGVFVLADVASDKIESAKKRNKGNETVGLLSAMIVSRDGKEERIGELTLGKLRGSTVVKLTAVAEKVLGGDDFLLDEDDMKKMGNIEG